MYRKLYPHKVYQIYVFIHSEKKKLQFYSCPTVWYLGMVFLVQQVRICSQLYSFNCACVQRICLFSSKRFVSVPQIGKFIVTLPNEMFVLSVVKSPNNVSTALFLYERKSNWLRVTNWLHVCNTYPAGLVAWIPLKPYCHDLWICLEKTTNWKEFGTRNYVQLPSNPNLNHFMMPIACHP